MATWSKLFSFFTWKNRPDTSTPLGQTLLNRLNTALNGIDDRVVELNSKMVSNDQIGASITNVRLDEKTGIFTFTRYDGTTFTINTALEEVVTNFKYDNATQQLVLTLSDGTTQDVDLSALITQYEFTNSATILWTITEEGKVVGNIKPNSITDQMLQTNYLADITTQANTALSASQSALESQSLAEQHAEDAEASADRAEEAANRAESVSAVDIATTEKAGIVKPDGTTITVDVDGTIHGNASVTVDTELSTSSTNPIANKAVAEGFENCFKKSGGTVNGTVAVKGILAVGDTTQEAKYQSLLRNAKRSLSSEIDANGNYALWDSTHSAYIINSKADGTNTFNGTASGNLPLTGGTLSGVMYFNRGGGCVGYGRIHQDHTATTNYGLSMRDYTADGKYSEIRINSAMDRAVFRNHDGYSRDILHTGNKPTGTYTGNGSSTARNISTGGIGSVCVITCASYSSVAIVTEFGAFIKAGSGTTVTGLASSAVKFKSGVLTIANISAHVNQSGYEYAYQVV